MKQPYIGNTKINKLYKGNELWCNWSSGGGDIPIEPTLGYVTDALTICCDAYGKTSSDTFNGFYDSINSKNFNLIRGSATYGTNCVDINDAYLVYGDGESEFDTTLKRTNKNSTVEIVFKCGSYNKYWKTIFTIGSYNPSPFSLKANLGNYGGNTYVYLMNKSTLNDRLAIRCLKKTQEWNHLVFSIDGNDECKVYVNGVHLYTKTLISYDNKKGNYTTGFYFGYNSSNDVPVMSIGSFRYYNKALNESEVLQNYNHEKTINRISNLTFPQLPDNYENADPGITDGPGEMNKGGIDSE